jgi:CsoR family transcriptional regulator, copper-sensing transcriptional repressor
MADHKRDLLNRLKTVEGHVRGVQRMVEEDAYCIDILKQTQAIQRALDKFNSLILAGHLNGCVTTAIRGEDPQERERVVTELLQVFETTSNL